MIDVDSEDEVNTQKKKVTREASKKTPKEAKKKVNKKITQKKGVQKKKDLTTKGNLKNPRQARKNVKVNTFGVNRGTMSFLKLPVKHVQTGGEEFAYLDPVQQHFPDPAPPTNANPPQIEKLSTPPKTAPKTTFNEFCKTEAQKTTVKTYPSFTKNFHGSIHINCRYTKKISNQL